MFHVEGQQKLESITGNVYNCQRVRKVIMTKPSMKVVPINHRTALATHFKAIYYIRIKAYLTMK